MGMRNPDAKDILISQFVIIFVATALVAARLNLRLRVQQRKLLHSDLIMVAAWIFSIITAAFSPAFTALDAFDPRVHTSLQGHRGGSINLRLMLKLFFAVNFPFYTTLYLCKAALLAVYLQVIPEFMVKRRVFLWVTIAFVGISYVITIVVLFCICLPLDRTWDLTPDRTCPAWTYAVTFHVGWVLSFMGDLLVFIIPWLIVPALHVQRRLRFGIYFTFLLGTVNIVVSVVRFVMIWKAGADSSISLSTIVLWSGLDVNIGLVVACLPSLRPYFGSRTKSEEPSRESQSGLSSGKRSGVGARVRNCHFEQRDQEGSPSSSSGTHPRESSSDHTLTEYGTWNGENRKNTDTKHQFPDTMAEVAAGVIAAEQAISTGVEVGVAATVARPTQPLTAVLSQIATTPEKDNSLSLARSHHTVTVIDNKAYIFGGKKGDGQLCNNDVHAISVSSEQQGQGEYACYPAVGDDGIIPPPRVNHAACARNDTLVVFGGQDGDDEAADDEFTLWTWEPKAARWATITAAGKAPQSRSGHQIFYDASKDNLVLHGGYENGQRTTATWLFDFTTRLWHELPDAPAAPLAAQFVQGTLYSISAESDLHGSVHYIKPGLIQDESLETVPEWTTVEFPSNPLVAGPRPRVGSALIPVTTGLGRRYLLYLLGSRQDAEIASSDKTYTEDHPFYSDMWTLQIPSDGYSATRVKDAIRDTLPWVESGSFSWHELEIAPAEMTQESGKVHPGPRGFFGADTCLDGKGVLLWGGVNAKGETEADGWLLKIS
ncbi:hypothetical protein F66182_7406 [Fusarium sp. NRRL 66182]|nr:hypothetical protein F66182_7406 [Fusarium sp. NRRL 66182]